MTRLAKRPILATRPSRPGVERKSARELELMRQAGHINGLALAAMRAAARPGVTTRHLDAIAERVIVANKGVPAFKGYPGPYPYPNTVTISVNDELVHGIPGSRVLHEGDVASLDCGTVRGKPSSMAPSCASGCCSRSRTIEMVTSSGTSSPRSIYCLANCPSGVWRLRLSRNRSPEAICGNPNFSRSTWACVPLPAPGPPINNK